MSDSVSEVRQKDEGEYFLKCEACGGWIDLRHLGSVIDHEGPLPHPVEGKLH
jgi:hypothetical protein